MYISNADRTLLSKKAKTCEFFFFFPLVLSLSFNPALRFLQGEVRIYACPSISQLMYGSERVSILSSPLK
jgi:hypothetical protein